MIIVHNESQMGGKYFTRHISQGVIGSFDSDFVTNSLLSVAVKNLKVVVCHLDMRL